MSGNVDNIQDLGLIMRQGQVPTDHIIVNGGTPVTGMAGGTLWYLQHTSQLLQPGHAGHHCRV